MKKLNLVCFLLLLVLPVVISPVYAETDSGTLKVLVDGFASDKGNVMIALCDSEECYKKSDKPFKGAISPVKDGKAAWIINDLPYGKYAISIYHDENSNAKLDTNALGIPKEKYGFSNNARATFGPPKFMDALFEFNKPEVSVSITVK